MKINENWEITSDSMNVVLSQRKTTEPKDGKPSTEYWKVEGYYRDLHGALRALVRKEVLGTGMADMQTVCDKIDELHEAIKALGVSEV
jgi:hypothetical protein